MNQFDKSLVVGKFCPLHFGHISVIRAALEASDSVHIISYTSEKFEHCEVQKRIMWFYIEFGPEIKDGRMTIDFIDPKTELVIEDDADGFDHRIFCMHRLICQKISVDAVFGSEEYVPLLANHIMTLTNKPVSGVIVDINRNVHKISGTDIREDNKLLFKFTPQCVQTSFVPKILVLGGESTGKTTFAKSLAAMLDTEWASEYGRDFWNIKRGKLEPADMNTIVAGQFKREHDGIDKIIKARKLSPLICDTSPLTTYWYSIQMFQMASQLVIQAVLEHDYDYVFLCDPGIEFVQDGTRRDADFRTEGHRFYIEYLNNFSIPYTLLHGSNYERVGQALKVLSDKQFLCYN